MTTETLDRPEPLAGQAGFGDLYAEVQRFYAHQMQLFDLHDAEGWAATFTEDAVFSVPTLDTPVRGRAGLAANVLRNKSRHEDRGEQHRHWIGMLDVRPGTEGTLRTRCYALVYVTPRGGSSELLRVCVMEDVLVRVDSRWHTRRRVVTRDDLA